jgi:hypothetical protein
MTFKQQKDNHLKKETKAFSEVQRISNEHTKNAKVDHENEPDFIAAYKDWQYWGYIRQEFAKFQGESGDDDEITRTFNPPLFIM